MLSMTMTTQIISLATSDQKPETIAMNNSSAPENSITMTVDNPLPHINSTLTPESTNNVVVEESVITSPVTNNKEQVVTDKNENIQNSKTTTDVFIVPTTVFSIDDASRGGSATFNGDKTEVVIPSNTFIDKYGRPIEGKVDMKYREMLNPDNINIRWIDITASQNGTPVNIQTGKQITIKINTTEETPNTTYVCFVNKKQYGVIVKSK